MLLNRDTPAKPSESAYTLIFHIHGDSDYLFHTKNGTPAEADQQALMKAMDAAEKAISGEVFIYHHQPAKRFLWMIPRRSSDLYQYKNGEKIRHVSYRLSSDDSFLETESALFHHYRTGSENEEHHTYLFYFGHEIPVNSYRGYYSSQPKITVDTETFADGIKEFLDGSDQLFDLVTLSTCSNGTPAMIKNMTGITHYLLASPQNLHLSHMEVSSLSLLENTPQLSATELASAIAKETYERLTETIHTVISLSVYDLNAVQEYIDSLYSATLRYEESENPNLFDENVDCAKLPFFEYGKFTSGVETLFRPARFGNRPSDNSHSGWGCKGDK